MHVRQTQKLPLDLDDEVINLIRNVLPAILAARAKSTDLAVRQTTLIEIKHLESLKALLDASPEQPVPQPEAQSVTSGVAERAQPQVIDLAEAVSNFKTKLADDRSRRIRQRNMDRRQKLETLAKAKELAEELDKELKIMDKWMSKEANDRAEGKRKVRFPVGKCCARA